MSNIFGTEHDAEHETYLGGDHYTFTFDNGYGASVIRNRISYGRDEGRWELAVLHGDSITYDTPLTNDVIGHLSEADVAETLRAIEALPKVDA